MTRQEILDIIAPVIRMHRAAGGRFDITAHIGSKLTITPGSDHFFGASFVTDLGNICRENFIRFAIGAEDNKPCIRF